MMWSRRRRVLALASGVMICRCGGEAVFDNPKGDSVAGGGSSTLEMRCDQLLEELRDAISEAVSCMCGQFDGCFLGPKITNECGCLIRASAYGDVASVAERAHSAWISAGCSPESCIEGCYAGDSWGCGTPGGECHYGQPGQCMHGDN